MPAFVMTTDTKVIVLTREQHHEATIPAHVEGIV